MEEPSLIKLLSDPLKIGSIIGGILIGIKIFLKFDVESFLKRFQKDDSKDPHKEQNFNSSVNSCPISNEQCKVYRDQMEQKIDLEIRSKLIEFKIDIQRYVAEEVRRNHCSNRIPNNFQDNLEEILSKYIESKYGEDKHVLK